MYRTTETSPILNLSTPHPPQDCDPFLDSTLVKVIKTTAYSVSIILSLGGNSLVIAVIYSYKKNKTNIPAARTLAARQVIGSTTCKFTYFATDTLVMVSILTLEVITVERFISLVFPMKKQPIRSNKECFIVTVLTWLLAAVCRSSHFYDCKLLHKGTAPYCVHNWQPAFDHAEAVKLEFTIILVAFTAIPFLLLTILYSAIIISLHRQKRNLHLAPEATKRRAKENRQITYMLVTVVVVFLVTWLPLNIHAFLSAFVWSSRRPCESRHLIFSANFLCYLSPAVNPFIYCFFMRSYRKGFKELFKCLRKGKTCCNN